jgi:hypothetical protein
MQLLFLFPALLAAVAYTTVFSKTNHYRTLRASFGIAQRHSGVDVGRDNPHNIAVAHFGARVALDTLRREKNRRGSCPGNIAPQSQGQQGILAIFVTHIGGISPPISGRETAVERQWYIEKQWQRNGIRRSNSSSSNSIYLAETAWGPYAPSGRYTSQ